ncbi:peptide/nickel transport system permease protein [Rhizobium sp. PP-F2F-G38]|uniref:ABC transporter permease n=1 Tax=Ferranicluibacter rubi TaxID=2715133 RepID=A0AA43ZEV5_9HYPH|nr:ABC transporter permease [Ferranicluibacter rubi]PYE30911.1 peptide/nickel transport system permease protein [Rhizobium sp. PP-WC-1G-195]PYE94397.1 peptide/nickel transport system permease protein [Rhizobium sp. PP-F2F-G38]TCQ08982.1 peptide/nickel transport system permease protein [Rhizobium sp. PP-F2F-G36]TCQ18089.1 peptide/nickel transport system permease protein [Rhizobium sp. PP-CC-3G-465]
MSIADAVNIRDRAAERQAAAAQEAAATGAAADGPAWSNMKAPDARSQQSATVAITNGRRALTVFLTNPNALFGAGFLAFVILVALAAPILYPEDPLSMVARPFLWPGQDPAYPLGTDGLGRDVLAGILHGARISLFVGLFATVLGLTFGVLVGATAGYFGGWVDDVLVRLIEIFQTLPSFVLLVVLVAIAQPSATTVTLAIAIISWPTVARLTRAEFRAIREKDFVVAARSLGYGHGRIIFHEILPNALPPIIVTSSVMVATAILMESALSFMGLGDPNVVSWGSMIGTGRELVRTAWYLTALPGLAIVFTVLALNLIGDGLNDALNPRFSQDR